MQLRTYKSLLIVLMLAVSLSAENLQEVESRIHSHLQSSGTEMQDRCGFRFRAMVQRYYDRLSPSLQQQLMDHEMLVAPTRSHEITSPSGHFSLHYDTDGRHAVSVKDENGNRIPDYIDSAAVILDHVWQVEIDQMGFRPPPDQNGKPVKTYHVYFSNFNYYGLTNFDLDRDIAALPGKNYTSYMELHNNYDSDIFYTRGMDGLRVTAAHEFHHAIQLGYNFRFEKDLFFMEMTSTWLEDVVYDQINDYYFYLESFFNKFSNNPVASRDNSKAFDYDIGFFPYANSLYLHMLEKLHSPQIVVECWDVIKDTTALAALEVVLQRRQSSFRRSHNVYANWLYFTGERSRSQQCFPEGRHYPELAIPTGDESAAEKDLDRLKTRHLRLAPHDEKLLDVVLKADHSQGMFNHLVNDEATIDPQPFNGAQSLYLNSDDDVVLVMTNSGRTKLSALDYSTVPAKIRPGPNPVKVHSGFDKVTFFNVPAQSVIKVYTLNGREVQRLQSGGTQSGKLNWNLRDRFGKRIATGVYLYIVQTGQDTYNGKIAVVR